MVNGERSGLTELEAEVGRTAASPAAATQASLPGAELAHHRAAGAAGGAQGGSDGLRRGSCFGPGSGQEGFRPGATREFDRQTAARYGSRQEFEEIFARRLLVNKFLPRKWSPRMPMSEPRGSLWSSGCRNDLPRLPCGSPSQNSGPARDAGAAGTRRRPATSPGRERRLPHGKGGKRLGRASSRR